MTAVRRLSDVDDLLMLSANDPYVRAWVDPARVESAWAHAGGALAWVTPSRRANGLLHVTAQGAAPAAAELTLELSETLGARLGSVTLPRDADRHLPPSHRLRPRNDWEWFVTWTAPPLHPRETEMRWLDDTPADELTSFLERWSPRHDAKPGRPGVLRWCGAVSPDGGLLAVAAHTEHVPGVPHLASIATSGDVRGQGYGAAVTAWLTRSLLQQGSGWVTLGMYSDNDVARRMYHRLGYQCDHFLTSGGLIVSRSGTSRGSPV